MPAIAGVANRKRRISCEELEGEDAGAIRASPLVNKPGVEILVPLAGLNALGLLRLNGSRFIDLTRAARSFHTFF